MKYIAICLKVETHPPSTPLFDNNFLQVLKIRPNHMTHPNGNALTHVGERYF